MEDPETTSPATDRSSNVVSLEDYKARKEHRDLGTRVVSLEDYKEQRGPNKGPDEGGGKSSAMPIPQKITNADAVSAIGQVDPLKGRVGTATTIKRQAT